MRPAITTISVAITIAFFLRPAAQGQLRSDSSIVACNLMRVIRLMPFSILNLFIQISYQPCGYLNPIRQVYRIDLVSILLCSALYSQRAGTTSASADARQPKAGSFPPFSIFF